MELDGKMLPEWLAIQDQSEFPHGFEYRSGYVTLAHQLEQTVHKEVTPTNIRLDGGYLTDHGPDHIRKLIDRISALLRAGTGSLTPYEAYLLLVAAQFHDVGNIFGREKHEEKSAEVMRDIGTLVPQDVVEQRLIHTIAQAHGGEEKDKLSTMVANTHVRGKPVRPQLLAAILKFADELAEDSDRAARYSFTKGLLPPESEIYHAYALCLNSIVIDGVGREIQMRFDIPRDLALRHFTKKPRGGGPVQKAYLLDEVLARTLKTHFERVYCSRFMRSFIDLIGVSVQIEISNPTGFLVLERIAYRLQEAGYPDTSATSIYAVCPDLSDWKDSKPLSGATLAERLDGANGQ